MGSASSKFKKYLHHGDEFAAMQLFNSSPELGKNLDPNLSYGEHHNHNTALHCVARHGMKHLLRTFLSELGGNPNKKNGFNETSLHVACQLTNNKSFSAMERRAACVTLILQWSEPVAGSEERERIDIGAQDKNGNTALHVAAASGLERCVQLLLAAGASLFVENNDKLTPCDMAVKNGHHSIAQLLESKMVFDDTMDVHNEDELSQGPSEFEEVYCGLRTQDLQEAKDQLLVETSDMLHVPLFTAEALLRDNEWSREILLDKWMKDPVACCQLAGVEPPQYHLNDGIILQPTEQDVQDEEKEFTSSELFQVENTFQTEIFQSTAEDKVTVECEICMLTMKSWEQPNVKISCNHNFCSSCWETYLSNKIIEGMQHNILCPAYQCHILVPLDVIERLVSTDLARRYLHFDIKAFVESNKCIKWCPVASCGRAVKLPETEQVQPVDDLRNLPNRKPLAQTSHAVDCGNGHFFCWECLGEAHAPSGCAQWRQWQEKVAQVRPEEIKSNLKDCEHVSNCLWLVTNSKPCPNCNSPIQKNEGCNHIKCSKCKFDFCWVCLESWKKHSSATGGYFRCNRYPAALKADEKQGMLISEALARKQQTQDLNKFLHYYTRFKNHENSRKMEEPLLDTVKQRMKVLASSLSNGKEIFSEKDKNCTKFVEDGVRELLKARRVLCGSYVHGFYLEDNGYNKTIFELMQNELEEVTEKLSEMIARQYLKTTRHTIMQTTSLCRRKRHEFVRAVSKGLIPPETPPALRKRKRRFPGLLAMDPPSDDEISHAIAASLKSLDPNNPWIKDSQGKHNNLSAIYEWPDFDSDEETEVSRALAVSLLGECSREGCSRPRARNPRTQAIHEFCSLKCCRLNATNESENHLDTVTQDYSMELAIALEMSRLQMIQDNINREQQKSEDTTVDYFLKSLAGQNLQSVGQNSVNLFSPDAEKTFVDKELVMFRPHITEDGRFEISDIHETCFNVDESDNLCLRRARSTGDLCYRDKRGRYREESRYHLDSDHSSQHEEKPEDIARRILAFPASVGKIMTGRQYLLFHQSSGSSVKEEGNCNQSSVEDTTISDSLNADLEVCEILSSSAEHAGAKKMIPNDDYLKYHKEKEKKMEPPKQFDDYHHLKNSIANEHLKQLSNKKTKNKSESVKNLIEEVKNTLQSIESDRHSFQIFNFDHLDDNEFLRQTPERASTGKIKTGTDLKKSSGAIKKHDSKNLLLGSEKTLHEAHKKAFRAAGGKIFHKSYGSKSKNSLRIRIAKSPLPTDSSNEYETETGIPKSPTLFISGVSISRTPEPCSPLIKKTKSPEHKRKSPVLKNLSNLQHKENSSPILNVIQPSIDLENMSADGNIFPPPPFGDDFLNVRQNRSSSLTVPKTNAQKINSNLNVSCGAICDKNYHILSVTPPRNSIVALGNKEMDEFQNKLSAKDSEGVFNFGTCNHKDRNDCLSVHDTYKHGSECSDEEVMKKSGKSKSAAEPEREREVFRFPRSSTDGALSCVLHIQESNLSSDDFHEVLFLLEPSPKHGSKRKKKSKKERDKYKENLNKEDCTEASSAL